MGASHPFIPPNAAILTANPKQPKKLAGHEWPAFNMLDEEGKRYGAASAAFWPVSALHGRFTAGRSVNERLSSMR